MVVFDVEVTVVVVVVRLVVVVVSVAKTKLIPLFATEYSTETSSNVLHTDVSVTTFCFGVIDRVHKRVPVAASRLNRSRVSAVATLIKLE